MALLSNKDIRLQKMFNDGEKKINSHFKLKKSLHMMNKFCREFFPQGTQIDSKRERERERERNVVLRTALVRAIEKGV
jgi:hypothetical protein